MASKPKSMALHGGTALLVLVLGWDVYHVYSIPSRLVGPANWRADVALVPSGDPNNQRTLRAIRLFEEGIVGRLLVSGAGFGGDSAEILSHFAVEQGVPRNLIIVEPLATSTWGNMVESRRLLRHQSFERLLVVTSASHARRAGLVAERVFGDLDVKVLPVHGSRKLSVFGRLNEIAKLYCYSLLSRIPWSWR